MSLPRGAGIRAAFDAACGGSGLHVSLEASSPAVVLDLVARGWGWVVAESMAAGQPGVSVVRLAAAPTSRLEVLWRGGAAAGPAARVLAATVRDHLATVA